MDYLDFRVPAGGFAQPLALWDASHQRAQRVALLLQRLFEHLQLHGPSEATRVTGEEVRRYMREAAPRHHGDEDDDLFPRLAQRLDALRDGPALAQAPAAAAALRRLQRDHGDLDALWLDVDAALGRAAQQRPAAADQQCAQRFVGSFLTHHGIEEKVIGPVAALVLRDDDLAAIGASMAARRGTTWSALAGR